MDMDRQRLVDAGEALRRAQRATSDASDAVGRMKGAEREYWFWLRLRLLGLSAELGAAAEEIRDRAIEEKWLALRALANCKCSDVRVGVDMAGPEKDRTVELQVGYDAGPDDLETEQHMPHREEDEE